jgi:hypothetical protein
MLEISDRLLYDASHNMKYVSSTKTHQTDTSSQKVVNDVFTWIILYVWHGQCSYLCCYLPHNIIIVVVVANSIQIELFHLPTSMHNSLFINNMYATLLSSICFEH